MALSATSVYLNAESIPKLNVSHITQTIESQYGERAGKRIRAWFQILTDAQHLDDIDKILMVNNFLTFSILLMTASFGDKKLLGNTDGVYWRQWW